MTRSIKIGLCLLALSLAAVCLFRAHGWTWMPGLGQTVMQYVLLGAALVCAKLEGKLRWSKTGGLLLALAVLLGGTYAVFGNWWMKLLNLPVLWAVSAQALFALTGQNAADSLSAAGIWEGFRRFFLSLFRFFFTPFRFMAEKWKQKHLPGLMAGICIALPVVAIVLVLLGSADAMFGGWLEQSADCLSFRWVYDVLVTVFFTLMLFSLLFSSVYKPRELSAPQVPQLPAITFLVTLVCLAVAYAAFDYVQVKYLFLGREAVRMQGGYAEYARSGFFQLVMVALITVFLELPALSLCRENKAVRWLCGLVSVLTLVVDASAFLRMRLYILAYGLTLLRVLTLWAMAMIAAALALIGVKCVQPGLRLCPMLTAIVLCGWVALNYTNVSARIAEYNVRAYNTGVLAVLDSDYLIALSNDVRPALTRVEDPATREAALKKLDDKCQEVLQGWYYWDLSVLK